MVRPQVLRALPEVEQFLKYCERRYYEPKDVILRAGEECNSLFLILDGSVSVQIEQEGDEDHQMVVCYLNMSDFVGEMGLFGEVDEKRSAMVIARTPCELAEISYERFNQIRQQFPDIIYAIGKQLSSRLRKTTRKLSDLVFVDVSGRVAHTLLDLCKQPDAMTHPEGMQIKITRQELGRIAGCSREMAGRVLKALEEDGLVSVSGKTMVVYGTR